MEKIASFTVDHRYVDVGVYISRIDGDITTYDLRMKKPNTKDVLGNPEMHTLEHLFATFVRNSFLKEKVIYFGPMGCQTGFYLLIRNADHKQVLECMKAILKEISEFEGDIPGASEIECGNYRSHDKEKAKAEALNYFNSIKNITVDDLKYKEG